MTHMTHFSSQIGPTRSSASVISKAGKLHLLAVLLFAFVACMMPLTVHAQEEKLSAATITSITRSTVTPGAIDVKGKAAPLTSVNVEIISDDAGPLVRDQTTTNGVGEWSLTVGDSSFRDGAYTLRAIVQDAKGTLGPVTEVRGYKVQPKPLLNVNGYEFGWLDAFLGALFLMFVLAAVGSWYYEHHRRLHEEQLLLAERDIHSMSHNLMEEVERLDNLIRDSKGMDPQIVAEAEYLLKSQQNKLQKMQGYLAIDMSKAH
jgi:hypothetical protein